MKQIALTFLLLFTAGTLSAQSQKLSEAEKQEQYKNEVREKLALDYSMPDYSISKIDPKVMGSRLAKMVEYICDNYQQYVNLNMLSQLQGKQIGNLNYARIQELKLDSVFKKGNEITVLFKTSLGPNSRNLKKANLSFSFVDGLSDSRDINVFFISISRYIKK